MITPLRVARRYGQLVEYLRPLQKLVRDTLQPFVDQNGYALVSRIKSQDSFAEKVESGRFKSWTDIDDLVAFAVVVPTLSQEKNVLDFLQSVFSQLAVRARGSARKAPDVFRFDATRFIGRLLPVPESPRGLMDILSFEIQIRSAFEHAWAVTTHALSYKAGQVSWQRSRLAAELKAAVEQLDMVVLGFDQALTNIEESDWPALEAQKRLAERFASMVTSGLLPDVLAPKDWSRFSQNVLDIFRASRTPMEQLTKMAESAIHAVEDEVKALGKTGVPISLSLWQFTFAILCKTGLIGPPISHYWPVVTPELEGLYPAVKAFADRFAY